MIGIGSCQIIVAMAINAVNSQYVKPYQALRLMAILAIGCPVSPQKRKPAPLMNLCNIVNKP
jgi:hypothetical protein